MAAIEDSPIRLGLIGTGLAVQRLHWPALRQLTDRFVVTAFADVSLDTATRFAAYSGLEMTAYTDDYHQILARDDVDAVLITVPISYLYQVTADALAAGKHVICEKPTGGNEEQARAFLALEDAYPDRTVLVAENYFYRDDIRLARSLLDEGAIGTPHLMAWRATGFTAPRDGAFTGTPWRHRPQYRGGAQLDSGVHNIAQIRMLCGGVARLHGAIQWSDTTIDGPSDLTLNLTFASGAIGSYAATYRDLALPDEPNDMRLYGTSGVLIIGGTWQERHVSVCRADGTTQRYVFQGKDGGYYGELTNFADALQYGETVVGTIRQSYANTMTVLRALDSAESGNALSIEDDPGAVALWRPRGAAGLFDGLPGDCLTADEPARV